MAKIVSTLRENTTAPEAQAASTDEERAASPLVSGLGILLIVILISISLALVFAAIDL